MKMRFNIDFTFRKDIDISIYRTNILINFSNILMKHISFVVINGIKYDRPKKDSHKVQVFYYFIEKNKMNITELMTSDKKHYYLNGGKYHSYNTYCLYTPTEDIMIYAKNGIILSDKEELFFLRKLKVNKLITQSK